MVGSPEKSNIQVPLVVERSSKEKLGHIIARVAVYMLVLYLLKHESISFVFLL